MADDIDEQVTAHIHEILRLVLDVKGETLRTLNELVGQTIQNYRVETGEGEPSPVPICVEFKQLRRSTRQPPTKRSYRKMQGQNTGTGRLAKKLKLADDKCLTDTFSTDGPFEETATHSSTNEPPTEPPSEYPSEALTNASATGSTLPTSEQTIDKLSADCPDTAEAIGSSGTDDLPTSATYSHIGGDATVDDMSPTTHCVGYDLLNEFFGQPANGPGPVCDVEMPVKWPTLTTESIHRDEALEYTVQPNNSETLDEHQNPPSTSINAASSSATDILGPDLPIASAATSESGFSGSSEPGSLSTDLTSYTPSELYAYNNLPREVQHATYIKRPILDDPTPWLEFVLTALQTGNTSRRSDPVPGVLDDIYTKGDFTLCVKIMTSIAENWVKCNRYIAKPIFDTAEERSREIGNQAGPHVQRLISEYVPRRQNQKAYLDEIARLNIRELANMEMQKLVSEPKELTGEFREESDYDMAIKHISKGNADNTRTRLRSLWKETYYWPMIQQGAKKIGPLPKSSGPKSEITSQEKAAAKKLTLAMRYGQDRGTIFKWTAYWKLLSELRDKGATTLLLYRTREFKSYFFQHPKELDILLSWHRTYESPLRQLGARTLAQEESDFSGKSDIEEKWIFDRLHAPQNLCWGDHLSLWDPDSTEYESFLANCKIKPTSRKSNIHILRYGLKDQPDCNKSSFISLVPYEGESRKRTLSSRGASRELLAVAPLVPISPGDFLGIFPGRLRYTDQKPTRSIPGPVSNLWLDYSVVTGKLSKMRVAKAGEMTNVCLAWEGVNEVKGEESFCQYLRVLVIATRHIMPFDQLVRPPGL